MRRIGAKQDEGATLTVMAGWAAFIAGVAASFTLSNFFYTGTLISICMILIAASKAGAESSGLRRCRDAPDLATTIWANTAAPRKWY